MFYALHRGLPSLGRESTRSSSSFSDTAQLASALLSGEAQFSGLNVGGAALLKSRDAPVRVVAAPGQPWIDAYAELGFIPASFRAIDLVK